MLLAKLVLVVMIAGYETFVSRLDVGRSRLEWMGTIGFDGVKPRVVAAIVAISAIYLLESFMDVGHLSDRELVWRVGLHFVFIISGVILALMDRISEPVKSVGNRGH